MYRRIREHFRQREFGVRRRLHLALPGLFPGTQYRCPVCGYQGSFMSIYPEWGYRKDALCPSCVSAERHRLQFLVLRDLFAGPEWQERTCLHFAPDAMLGTLRSLFGRVVTADYVPGVGELTLDMRKLDIPDESFDCVFASHVLEHIKEDGEALAEVRRILKPGGVAILPVPLVCETTVEYPVPVRWEAGHVRAPGLDYFDRYRGAIGETRVYLSTDFPDCHQLWVHEDRSGFPTPNSPYRKPMAGLRHIEAVPVSVKAG